MAWGGGVLPPSQLFWQHEGKIGFALGLSGVVFAEGRPVLGTETSHRLWHGARGREKRKARVFRPCLRAVCLITTHPLMGATLPLLGRDSFMHCAVILF